MRPVSLYAGLSGRLDRLAPALVPTLARFTFAATLLFYFWGSALTKTGPGLFGVLMPTSGGYAQIFPRAFEAVNYNTDGLTLFHWAVAVAGTVAEWLLPALIVLGLLTRLAAFGMIGFVVVQSLTDLYGHGARQYAETVGAWFDRDPGALILDQRLFWIGLLATLVMMGAGPLSLDRLFRNAPWVRPAALPR